MMAKNFNDMPRDLLFSDIDIRLLQFARLLRDNGYIIGQDDICDAIRYCADRGVFVERILRQILRILFCRSLTDIDRFDELYDTYWHGRVSNKRSILKSAGLGGQRSLGSKDPNLVGGAKGLAQYFEWADAGDADPGLTKEGKDQGEMKQGGASPYSHNAQIDLDTVSDPEELERMMMLAQRLGSRLRYRLSKRHRISSSGQKICFRRTFRRSIETGGLPLKLDWRIRRQLPYHIILFVDVSGSMDPYSLFFARFAYSMTGGFTKVDTFLFHTNLVPITETLKEADPIKMMAKLALISRGWSGGTRIGGSLAAFNTSYAKKLKSKRTIAIVISDGYDTGETEQLEAELTKLKKRCHKLIWLNPLLGRQSDDQLSRGLQAAQPHIDILAPGHNLRSLMKLEKTLVSL